MKNYIEPLKRLLIVFSVITSAVTFYYSYFNYKLEKQAAESIKIRDELRIHNEELCADYRAKKLRSANWYKEEPEPDYCLRPRMSLQYLMPDFKMVEYHERKILLLSIGIFNGLALFVFWITIRFVVTGNFKKGSRS